MARDPMRQALEETAVAVFNKILDFMDEGKINEISRNSLMEMRDGFKSKCDLR